MPAPVASGWSIAGRAFHPLESAAFARRTPFAAIRPRFVVYHFPSVRFFALFSIIWLMATMWIVSVKKEMDVDRLSITTFSTNSIASAHQLTTSVVN